MLNIALRAARIAGEQIARAVERLDLIKSEQADVANFLKDTCVHAEQTITHTIQKAYPSHRVVGVYSGEHAPLEEGIEVIWQINPIDSVLNFSNGLPVFALCMAGYQNGRLEHSVVLNPLAGEEFTASRGRGAQLNGKRLRVSSCKSLDGAMIGTGFFNRSSDKAHLGAHLEMLKNIAMAGGNIHSGGSAALNMAYTAAGRLDGFYQIGLYENELEAALLLIQEAGGLVGDFAGGNSYRSKGNLVAGNPKMLKALLQSLRPSLTPELS
ncbi:inositol monophosphatase [Marinobacterium sp. CAU 1594]|nr:inositol monophosphatase [Marinobacterium arenosum]